MAFPPDFMTYQRDIRAALEGSVVSYLPDTALVDLAEGEPVGWNASVPGLQRMQQDGGGSSTTTQTQVFVGISRDSQNAIASLGNQSALSNFLNLINRIGVWTTGIHLLIGKSGDVFSHGLPVYLSGNYVAGSGTVRQITVTAPVPNAQIIASVHLPDGSSITGNAATRIPVLIDFYTLAQKIGFTTPG